jgi:probable HAF family extracellular repeat protein
VEVVAGRRGPFTACCRPDATLTASWLTVGDGCVIAGPAPVQGGGDTMPVTRRTDGKARRLGAAATVILALTLTGGIAPARARTGAPDQPGPGVPEVTVTVLPPLPGTEEPPYPSDINNHGQVVGTSSGRAVLWDGGEPIELPQVRSGYHYASFVNDRGDVVVQISVPLDPLVGSMDTGYRWFEGEVTHLGSTPGGAVQVHDLNERGQIALSRRTSTSGREAGLWADGALTPIAAPSGTVAAIHDLSDAGHVVGDLGPPPALWVPNLQVDGFLWRNGNLTRLGLQPTTIRSVNSHGQAIAQYWTWSFLLDQGRSLWLPFMPEDLNDRGQVAGNLGSYEQSRAVLWDDGYLTELRGLGTGPSHARKINERGQVVGTSDATDGTHAVLWTSGHPIDLGLIARPGSSPGSLTLNDAGQVAGQRETPQGPQAVVWSVDDADLSTEP